MTESNVFYNFFNSIAKFSRPTAIEMYKLIEEDKLNLDQQMPLKKTRLSQGSIKFRTYTGSLVESMKTVVDISSIDELIKHLNKDTFFGEVEQVKFKHSCFDNRVGWDTYYVLCRHKGQSNFEVFGMSNGVLTS